MLDQLSGILATAAFETDGDAARLAGAVSATLGVLAAYGVNVTPADATTATTIGDAIAVAKHAIATQGLPVASREQAYGALDTLAASLGSVQPATAFQAITLGSNIAAAAGTTPKARAVASSVGELRGVVSTSNTITAGSTIITVPSAVIPAKTQTLSGPRLLTATQIPAPVLTVASTSGVVTANATLPSGVLLLLDTKYPLQ